MSNLLRPALVAGLLACAALVVPALPGGSTFGAALSGAALAQTPVLNLDPAASDPVVARVNGGEIRRSEVVLVMQNLPEQYRSLPPVYLFDLVLSQMVDRKLMVAAADKAKLGDDPMVKKRVEEARERAMQEAYVTREVEKGMTEEKLRERYKKMVAENAGEEEIRARHILVQSEDEAKALIVELKAGKDFAELAKSKSTGPSANSGGDLGFFKKEDMVPEFTEAAFALKPGGYTEAPVKSQFGWHVIKLEERRKAPPPEFEATKDELRQQVARDSINEIVARLRADAKVEQFDMEGNPRPEQPKKP